MGAGTEILSMVTLGLVVVGPKRPHATLRHLSIESRRPGWVHQEGWNQFEWPLRAGIRVLFRRFVIQVLPEPALDFAHAHSLAFAVVGDLVTVDLAEAEIS